MGCKSAWSLLCTVATRSRCSSYTHRAHHSGRGELESEHWKIVQPQHTVVGNGGYRKAYNKIVRGSD